MKYKEKPISDDEIRVIGSEHNQEANRHKATAIVIIIAAALLVAWHWHRKTRAHRARLLRPQHRACGTALRQNPTSTR